MRDRFNLFVLKLRYLLRDPWDLLGNHMLVREIDYLEKKIKRRRPE